MGQEAEGVVKAARRALAEAIGARPGQIVFTGSGTESDNLALRAAFRNPARASESAVFISAVEHPAVRAPAARLAELGARLTVLPVDGRGGVDLAALESGLADVLACGDVKRVLISVMHVNNELGAIQPVAEIARVRARVADRTGAEILLHTDAIQSFLKLPMDVASASGAGGFAGVDLISFSAHKSHGPKGVGALYARHPERLVPLARGGGQEGGARSGTENVPGVAGFGAAVSVFAGAEGSGPERAGAGSRACRSAGSAPESGAATMAFVETGKEPGLLAAGARVAALRNRLLCGIEDMIPDVRVNSPAEASTSGEAGGCSPYILNVSFLGTRGEVILHDLEQHGVFVSTGSACSNIGKGAKKMNPVLAAIGLTPQEAEGAIRFGLSRYNTEEEIDYAVERLKDAVFRFRKTGSLR
jgi:cysteine desulfurase